MRTTRASGGALVLVLGAACGLDTSGLGSGSGAMPVLDDDGSEAQGGTTSIAGGSEASSGGGSSGGPVDLDTGPDPTATTTGNDDAPSDGSTGPGDPCDNPAPQTFDITVDMALLDSSMHLDNSSAVGTYAYSEQANAGKASFQFNVQCEAEFRVWAYVHDPAAGPLDLGTASDPDSYLVAFDGQDESDWWYGCQLYAAEAFGGPTWAWVNVRDNGLCINEDFRRTLGPGTHLFHMTNREAGTHQAGDQVGDVAAVTRVVITSDPGFSP